MEKNKRILVVMPNKTSEKEDGKKFLSLCGTFQEKVDQMRSTLLKNDVYFEAVVIYDNCSSEDILIAADQAAKRNIGAGIVPHTIKKGDEIVLQLTPQD